MELKLEQMDDALLVRVLEQRLDAAVAVQFKDAMRDLAPSAPPRVILDLASVRFLDSSGLGAVIGAMKALAPKRLELAHLTPNVRKVFELTHMNRIFTIHPVLPVADRETLDHRHAG